MNAFTRVLRTALFELGLAIRSRRAVVTVLLFALVGAGVMYMTVGLFSSLEEQVVKLLGLPVSDNPGEVTMTLWRSTAFKSAVSRMIGSSLVFNDVLGQHPLALAFAGLIFGAVPLLTLITTAPNAANEIRSGSVRYALLRVSRTEWTLGLFLAEAMVLFLSMMLLAAAAGAVSVYRLPGWSGLGFLPSLFTWGVRAWVYSIAWLGVFTGASMCVKSPGKATGFAILVYMAFIAFGYFANNFFFGFDFLRPQGYEYLLWRTSFSALLEGVTGSLAVAFLYLGLGSAVFARRDI